MSEEKVIAWFQPSDEVLRRREEARGFFLIPSKVPDLTMSNEHFTALSWMSLEDAEALKVRMESYGRGTVHLFMAAKPGLLISSIEVAEDPLSKAARSMNERVDELLTAIERAEQDIGGSRPMKKIVADLGPAYEALKDALQGRKT